MLAKVLKNYQARFHERSHKTHINLYTNLNVNVFLYKNNHLIEVFPSDVRANYLGMCSAFQMSDACSPYLTLAIDADVQRVSLTSGAVDDSRGALRVEVIALRQAVERAGLHATWNTRRTRRYLQLSLRTERGRRDPNPRRTRAAR